MKVYRLYREQLFEASLEVVWDFFSSPKNLKKITPPYMGFDILNENRIGKMYSGQIISYKVKPILGIPLNWTTEIKFVDHHKSFIDEQRFGPYRLWHHRHEFFVKDGKVMMTDEVHYALPLGPLGRIANSLFVRKQLKEIFDYRFKAIDGLI